MEMALIWLNLGRMPTRLHLHIQTVGCKTSIDNFLLYTLLIMFFFVMARSDKLYLVYRYKNEEHCFYLLLFQIVVITTKRARLTILWWCQGERKFLVFALTFLLLALEADHLQL